jgi:putative ATP-binding cassette transporter
MRTAAREVSLTQMRSLSVRMDDDDGDDGETGVAGSAPAPDAAARAKRDVLLEVLGSPTARAGRQKRIARWRFRDVFRLWRLAFKGDCRQDAIFGVVVVANVIAQVISLSLPVYSGQIISELTGGDTHGEAANGDRLAHQLAEAIGVILVYVLLSCSASVVLMLTGISWRAALTSELQRLYMLAGRSLAFHKVQLFDCDNPDQRIAADTANFTKLCCGGVAPPLSSVISQLIQSLSLAIAATVVSVKRAGWRITLISYAYNILTILLNVAISLPIAASTAAQGAHEGNFRRAHVRLQTYAESIALYGAQGAEHAQLEARLTPVIVNQRKLTLEYFRLIVSITFSGVGGGLIGLMIAAVSVWSGERKVYSIAELSEVLGTLDLLSAALQALPALLPEIATIAGLSKRVIDLHRTLDTINNAPPPAVEPSDSLDSFGCADLSFSIPDGTRTLARALSFKVSGPGGSVLIVGESGCGKSSLLRCLVGMWDADAGAIFRPRGASVRGGVFLLPQKPYMCVGTLRMQVCFPLLPEADEALGRAQDVRILELLDAVALGEAATQFGLDSSLAWEDVLSVGEQQRLSFARLLFHAPRFAALDEATSALDLEIEARCMQLVVDAGIALLSVAHRPSVARFHQFVLRLRRDGTHELTPIEPAHGIEASGH